MARIAKAELKSLVERIERLEEEKKALADDIRAVYTEGKAKGFDTKTLRKVIALRRVDKSQREQDAALLDVYLHALGMLPGDEDPGEGDADDSGGDDKGDDDSGAARVTPPPLSSV